MPMPIADRAVRDLLTPALGSQVLARTGLAENLASMLRGYAPYRMTLSELGEQVANRLFSDLYALLGPRMTVMLDNGRMQRIPLQAVTELSDALMGLLFEAFTLTPDHRAQLTEYAMHTTSLSAMRVLLTRYRAEMDPMEIQIMARVIRDNYPPEAYAAWLE